MLTTVTDLLDLLGALALVVAAALTVGIWLSWPGGCATAGAGLLLVSWLIDRTRVRPRREEAT